MKVLLIAFLFTSLNGFAQNKDSTRAVQLKIKDFHATNTFYNNYYGLTYSCKPDTVKVIMLCCDTVIVPGNFTYNIATFNDKGEMYDVAKTKNRVPYVYWQFGYRVAEERFTSGGIATDVYPYYSNKGYKTSYLDENKKPLSKNILVWIDIPLIR